MKWQHISASPSSRIFIHTISPAWSFITKLKRAETNLPFLPDHVGDINPRLLIAMAGLTAMLSQAAGRCARSMLHLRPGMLNWGHRGCRSHTGRPCRGWTTDRVLQVPHFLLCLFQLGAELLHLSTVGLPQTFKLFLKLGQYIIAIVSKGTLRSTFLTLL